MGWNDVIVECTVSLLCRAAQGMCYRKHRSVRLPFRVYASCRFLPWRHHNAVERVVHGCSTMSHSNGSGRVASVVASRELCVVACRWWFEVVASGCTSTDVDSDAADVRASVRIGLRSRRGFLRMPSFARPRIFKRYEHQQQRQPPSPSKPQYFQLVVVVRLVSEFGGR